MTGLLNEILAEQRTQELLRDARQARGQAERSGDRAPARRLAGLLGRLRIGALRRSASRRSAEAATGCSRDC